VAVVVEAVGQNVLGADLEVRVVVAGLYFIDAFVIIPMRCMFSNNQFSEGGLDLLLNAKLSYCIFNDFIGLVHAIGKRSQDLDPELSVKNLSLSHQAAERSQDLNLGTLDRSRSLLNERGLADQGDFNDLNLKSNYDEEFSLQK